MLAALDMATIQRRPEDVIHHSDPGCQSTSLAPAMFALDYDECPAKLCVHLNGSASSTVWPTSATDRGLALLGQERNLRDICC